MIEHLKNLKKYLFGIVTGLVVATFAIIIIWVVLARNYGITIIKNELSKIILSLNQEGYDIAYDNIEFTPISPFRVMEIKNFRLYKADKEKNFEWQIPEVSLNMNIWDYDSISLTLENEQSLKLGTKKHEITFQSSKFKMNFNNFGFQNFIADIKGLEIAEIAKVENIRIASQRMSPLKINEEAPSLENYMEITKIQILMNNNWNMAKEIEEIYVNAKVMGGINSTSTYGNSLKNWQKHDGYIEIKKLILNWQPLVMVSRGSLNFNKNFQPNLSLITTSKALVEVLDNLEQANIIDRKGVFVAKILLGNKATKASDSEQYYTIVTPIDITPNEVTIEKIPVWKKSPQ